MENNQLPAPQLPTRKEVIKGILFFAVVILGAYLTTKYIGLDNLRENVSRAGIFGPLVVILLKATTIVVVPLGGMPLYPIAGALFGFWNGFLFTLIGDVLGSTIAFYLSRFFGTKILLYFMSESQLPMIEKLTDKFSQFKTFLKARLFFTGFPELFAYAAGLTKISFPVFIIVHSAIHAVLAALYVSFGDLLVAKNTIALIISGGITFLLAFIGVLWFQADLQKGS